MKKIWVVEEIDQVSGDVVFRQYYDTFDAANSAFDERKQLNESNHLSVFCEEKKLLTE